MKNKKAKIIASAVILCMTFALAVCCFGLIGLIREHNTDTYAKTESESTQPVVDMVVAPVHMTMNTSTVASDLETVARGNNLDILGLVRSTSDRFYEGEFKDKAVINTEPYLNVRKDSSTESEVVGMLYPVSCVTVLETGDEWTKIQSGEITGYIKNENALFGKDAEELITTLAVEDLRDAVPATAQENKTPEPADKETAKNDDSDTGTPVQNSNIKPSGTPSTDKPHTPETETPQTSAPETQAPEVSNPGSADDDTYLLACIVHVEAGGESYEGKLAVANVIMNRVRSGSFPNSISEVVYQRGQFPGAHNGVLANRLSVGPNSGSLQAAQEAIAGVNNIGNYLFFNGNAAVNTSKYPDHLIIGGHTFYNY